MKGEVYIIDFGNTFEYYDSYGKHKQMTTGNQFKGTLHFASIDTHLKFNQGRRDDIECLAYTILYYLTNGVGIDWMNRDVQERIISNQIH